MSVMMMMMTGSHARRNVYARQFYAAFKKYVDHINTRYAAEMW